MGILFLVTLRQIQFFFTSPEMAVINAVSTKVRGDNANFNSAMTTGNSSTGVTRSDSFIYKIIEFCPFVFCDTIIVLGPYKRIAF